MPLSAFSQTTRDWFLGAFAEPTAAQAQAWPAIASGEHVLISAPTGSGKTLAAFLWAIDRLASERSRGDRPRDQPGLRLAAQGAVLRHRPQPARAAARDRRRPEGRGADRRHSAEGTPGDAQDAAGHPDHHPRVALPDADRPGTGAVRRHPLVHRRRDPRGGGDQARLPSGADAGAARAGGRQPGPADRAERHAEPARGGRPIHGRPAARAAGSSTPVCARSST